jgi:hypothetical protein
VCGLWDLSKLLSDSWLAIEFFGQVFLGHTHIGADLDLC